MTWTETFHFLDQIRAFTFTLGLALVFTVTMNFYRTYKEAKKSLPKDEMYHYRRNFYNSIPRGAFYCLLVVNAWIAFVYGQEFPPWATVVAKLNYITVGYLALLITWGLYRQQKHDR